MSFNFLGTSALRLLGSWSNWTTLLRRRTLARLGRQRLASVSVTSKKAGLGVPRMNKCWRASTRVSLDEIVVLPKASNEPNDAATW